MEMHTRQSLQAIHQISASDGAAGISPWQDIAAASLRRLAAGAGWLFKLLRRCAA